MILLTLFYNPILLSWHSLLWLLLPLCLVVAIIYKTIRIRTLGRLWWEILYLFAYILGGLATLGAASYLILNYWP